MKKKLAMSLPMWGIGATAPTGGCGWIPWEDADAALKPAVGNPDDTFSSLPTVGGDSKDDARDDPKIGDGREDIDAEELVGCNDPVEAAAAAAAENNWIRST